MTLLYGGRSLAPERQALAKGVQIVIGTPGRTLDHLRRGNLLLDQLRILVLDEGDEMLDRGFAPDVECILSQTPAQRQIALFSATVPEWVTKTAARHLRNPVTIHVDRETETPPEIRHMIYRVDQSVKFTALRTLLDQRGDGSILVFGRTKHGVKKLARQLSELGYPVGALQGNLSQNARERVMADFRLGGVPILLATNVAARGLDVEGIQQVINYELPESALLFTHRVGRTGRMGREGEAITFVTPEEGSKWRQMERALGRRLPCKAWPNGDGPVSFSRGTPTTGTATQAATLVVGSYRRHPPVLARPVATSGRKSATVSFRRSDRAALRGNGKDQI
jgi:ATP-dependent RNA helicase DeaD